MREVGVRELKASLSELLKEAGRGERVRVTVHGKPVADIVAPGDAPEDRRARLIAEGRITPATKPHPTRAPRLWQATESASAMVIAERDAER